MDQTNPYYNDFLPYGIGTLDNEGGLVTGARAKKIKDSGGATKYGISLKFLSGINIKEADFNHDGVIDEKDIVILTEEQALMLYFKYFWNPYYKSLSYTRLIFRLYDTGVNIGPERCVRIWQNTINKYLGYIALKVDGQFGPKSFQAAQVLRPGGDKTIGELSYPMFIDNLTAYYKSLKKPQFISSWLRRLKTFIQKFRRSDMNKAATIFLLVLFSYSIGCAQPNSQTKITLGIVNPQANKTYLTFKEVLSDSNSTAALQNGMDYQTLPSGYEFTMQNQHTLGDTLFGEVNIPDVADQKYIHAGLVQKDNTSGKYSILITSYWVALDRIEPMEALFFIRKAQ